MPLPKPAKGTRVPGSGRKPGTPNKLNAALKDTILGALADLGGREWLVEMGKKNPVPFLGLVGRVLPLQVKDGGEEPRLPQPVIHEHLGR